MPSASPLRLVTTEPADKQVEAIGTWLKSLPFGGAEAAARFEEALGRVLPGLCQDIAERLASGNNLPCPNPAASVAFARPAYKHTFTTATGGKRKRRQTAGVYVILYDLPNTNTLRVIAVRHGAAEPLTAFLAPLNDEGGAT